MSPFPVAPDYWQEASQSLPRVDPIMRKVVEAGQGTGLYSRGSAFGTLARAIVGQQISVKAAASVWARLLEKTGDIASGDNIKNAENLLTLKHEGLQGVGLSQRKISYLLDLSSAFQSGRLQPENWKKEEDETIINVLCSVKGVGRWTAEMFLIFHLLRPDVFPVDDIGLQKAVAKHYFQGEKPSRSALILQGNTWRPWRSVATWYLWRSLDPVPVDY